MYMEVPLYIYVYINVYIYKYESLCIDVPLYIRVPLHIEYLFFCQHLVETNGGICKAAVGNITPPAERCPLSLSPACLSPAGCPAPTTTAHTRAMDDSFSSAARRLPRRVGCGACDSPYVKMDLDTEETACREGTVSDPADITRSGRRMTWGFLPLRQ